ncbi:hypothetical protein [uncultured Chryseobacterium sp.]|uniref:hypothetical protein n=1 Tax=uncultured Chryseobacterium sp. TaxID=259322 RepID=UPI0025F496DF|nr:hypothetical protein [uncultured Chryseobacterium sp.]
MRSNRILIVVILIIAMIFLYDRIFSLKDGGGFLDEMREKEIKSLITRKYINHDNHNIPFLIYGNKDSIIIYRDWWDKIFVGDSIIKPKGSLEVIIESSDKIEKFNYEDKLSLE